MVVRQTVTFKMETGQEGEAHKMRMLEFGEAGKVF
jgi:hypothetical protein